MMIERPDVDELLAGELGEFLHEQTEVRKRAKAKAWRNFAIGAAGSLVVFALAWQFADVLEGFQWWGVIGAIVGTALWTVRPILNAQESTKRGINHAIARALGVQYNPKPLAGPGFAKAKFHKLFPEYTKTQISDGWDGEVAGHAFSLREAHLHKRSGSGKEKVDVSVFHGPVMTISCDRSFHGTTIVGRQDRHTNFGIFGEKDRLQLNDRDFARVDITHPEFEDQFTIYSTDQVEARYLVHPTYVERLIELERAFAGNKIRTLFHEGDLIVVLQAKNLFESGGMNAEKDREMIELCVSQFMALAELCRSLNEPGR